MAEPTTVVTCPHCGHPYPMTDLQREVYRGRNMGCMNCGRPFRVDPPTTRPESHAPDPAAEPGPSAADGPTAFGSAGHAAAGAGPAQGQILAGAAADQPNVLAGAGVAAGIVAVILLVVATMAGYVASSEVGGGGTTAFYVLSALALTAAVVAIGGGITGLLRSRRPPARGRGLSVAALALGGVGLLVAGCVMLAIVPAISRTREEAHRQRCHANLQAISAGLGSYVVRSPGRKLPDTLDALAIEGLILPDSLVCPGSGVTPAAAPSPGAKLAGPLPTSYKYLVAGKSLDDLSYDTVVAHEPTNHHDNGIHVLFVDGTVVFCNRQQAAQLMGELDRGLNPPPMAAVVRP